MDRVEIPALIGEPQVDNFTKAKETFEPKEIPVANEHLLQQLRDAYASVDALLLDVLPASRLSSLARTDLESSGMWAVKALSRS